MRATRPLISMMFALLIVGILAPAAEAQKGKPQPPPPPPCLTLANPAFAYSRYVNGQEDLMVMDADGSHQCVLVSQKSTYNTNPDWSPDGKQLVFQVEQQVRGKLLYFNYKVNVDGTGLTRMQTISRGSSRPGWSPVPLGDKKYKIVYSSKVILPDGTYGPEKNELWIVDADGTSDPERLTFDGDVWDWDADWSPTGDRLAVDTYDGTVQGLSVYRIGCIENSGCFATLEGDVLNVDGSPLKGKESVGFDWAKTQDKIVVGAKTGHGQSGDTFDLWIIDLSDPAHPVQLTDTPDLNETLPTWSPDDSVIAFRSFPTGGPSSFNTLRSDVTNDRTGGTPLPTQPADPQSVYGLNWRRNP
ncbi:MAG: hypothetical protein ACM3NO_11595 [Deltaproteobacteria bacterium]